jgi:hypothetical protein
MEGDCIYWTPKKKEKKFHSYQAMPFSYATKKKDITPCISEVDSSLPAEHALTCA